MQIRHARPEDLPAMQEIFADARAFMRENGNPDQWGDRFPTQEMIDRDLALHRSYVCEDNGKIAATFAFMTDGEPTYRVIRGGAWLDDAPYGVVHRIAAAKGTHGAASFCMNWCMEQCGNIRIDTHANNKSMQGLLNKQMCIRDRASTTPAITADTIPLNSRYGTFQCSMDSLCQSVCRMVFRLSRTMTAEKTGRTIPQADRNIKSLSAGRIRWPRYRKCFIRLTLSYPAGYPCAAGRAARCSTRMPFPA